MSSIRERLAAKKRRRMVFPVQISDPGGSVERLERARKTVTLLELSGVDEDDERMVAADAEVAAALAEHDAHFEFLQFHALNADDMEALAANYRDDEGELDTKALTVPLAAACAVDPELQDEAYWAELLASDEWSHAERTQLYTGLLGLNWSAPGALVPKD